MSSLLAQRLLRISPSVGRPSKLHLKNCKSQHKMSCIPPRCFNVCVLQAPKEEGGKPVSDQLLPPFVITDEQGKPLGAVQVRLGPPPSPPPSGMQNRTGSATPLSPLYISIMPCLVLPCHENAPCSGWDNQQRLGTISSCSKGRGVQRMDDVVLMFISPALQKASSFSKQDKG